ncbi:MAG: hypothetical protein IJ119_03555 [Clostridia bacterium]|nr:hypothetical protein [Clostridia bacterium]
MKNSTRSLIIIAIALVVFSVIAFAIPFAHTTAFWVAYGFGALAILFQLYIFKASFAGDGDAKSRFYGFPIARLGVYYLVVQLIVSVIEMALARVIPTGGAVAINVLLLALAVVGCITVDAMRDEIIRQDTALKKNVGNMRELQSLSAALVGQCADASLKPTLQKLADEFRYSDPVSSEKTLELEEDMKLQLGDIQQALVEGDSDGAKKLCGKLMGSLAERNRVCSVSK